MLRIRYKDHPTRENCVISINDYVSQKSGARYRVVLDYNEINFAIRNERTKEFVFKSKNYGNLNVLRRNARAKLKDLGVYVGRESRNRTFGICEKNWTQDKQRKLEKES